MIDISIAVIKRDGTKEVLDCSKIVDAVNKAAIKAEEKKVEKEIHTISILQGLEAVRKRPEMYVQSRSNSSLAKMIYDIVDRAVDEIINDILEREYDDDYQSREQFIERSVLEFEKERLENKRIWLRALRKAKTERVSALIRVAWKYRNNDVGRSCTGAISDPMALTIPTPPTALAALCSLERGGVVIEYCG